MIHKTWVVIGLMMFYHLVYSADAVSNQTNNKIFQDACNKAWMERWQPGSDKVDFQNFGEKYCNCAIQKPMNTDAEMKQSAKVCMSQTLLHDAIDMLEDKQGLDNISENVIETACQNKWKLLVPTLNESSKQAAIAYCQCTAPKINALNEERDTITDKQWADKIDEIADNCATLIVPTENKKSE